MIDNFTVRFKALQSAESLGLFLAKISHKINSLTVHVYTVNKIPTYALAHDPKLLDSLHIASMLQHLSWDNS